MAGELKEFVLQLAGLGLEVPDALGSRPQGADGHAVLGGQRGAVTEAGAACDLLRPAEATQFGAEVVRCGDDQRLELVDGCGGGVHGALPGGQ
ncbi:hypothetical protein [Streptomyces sp. NPDC003480]